MVSQIFCYNFNFFHMQETDIFDKWHFSFSVKKCFWIYIPLTWIGLLHSQLLKIKFRLVSFWNMSKMAAKFKTMIPPNYIALIQFSWYHWQNAWHSFTPSRVLDLYVQMKNVTKLNWDHSIIKKSPIATLDFSIKCVKLSTPGKHWNS